MKTFCVLAAALISTAVAKSARDVIEELWVEVAKGEGSLANAFSDDFTVDINTEIAGYDYKWNGKQKNGVNGFTKASLEEENAKFTFYKFERSNFADNGNSYSYILEQFGRTDTGIRYTEKQFQEFQVNEDGKINFVSSHTLHGTSKRTDAKSAFGRGLDAWIAGDIEGVFAGYHDDVVIKTDIGKSGGDDSCTGTFVGKDGLNDLLAKEVAAFDFSKSKREDGTFIMNYKHLSSNNDGKTAFFQYELPLTFNSGAEIFCQMLASVTVDDFGLATEYNFMENNCIEVSPAPDNKEL